jgi:quercetin dioxygenase-like cupin family protein
MRLLAILSGALALTLAGSAANSQPQAMKMLDPAAIEWGPGPDALPPGAQAALLYGDPHKAGLFVMRLKFPKGYLVAPHTHPQPEIVTVISGHLRLGMGRLANKARTRILRAGSFSALGPNMPHFAFADEETVIQISTTGPWSLTYINPANDPRNKRK